MFGKRAGKARPHAALQRGAVLHFFAALLLLSAASFTETAFAQGMLDQVVGAASSASNGWMQQSLEFAKTLFFGLAALEFVWAAMQLTLQKGELSDLAVGLLMKIISISFFSMILIYAPDWIPRVIDSFKQAGTAVGNSSYGTAGSTNMQTCTSGTLSPSAVLDQGVCVSSKLTTTSLEKMGVEDGSPGLVDVVTNFFPMLMLGLASIATLIGFVVLAIQLTVTLIESFIVIGGGVLMLGFMGSRWTMNYGERFFGYAVSIGVKLFTLYLIVALGESFVNALVNYIAQDIQQSGTVSINTLLGTAGGSLAYGAIGYLVPGLAGSMLNGSPSLSMSNVGQAGKGIASMPVGAALSTGAAGARAMGLGAGGAAFLASKFGGGGGGIGGTPPGGGGGGGSVLGSFDSGGGKPNPFGGKTDGTNPAGGSPTSRGTGKSGPAGSPTGTSNPQAGGDGAPGFQSPRSMDPDRRERDVMLGGSGSWGGNDGQRKEPGKMSRFASAMNNMAREMQYASHRHQTGLGHDGSTGGAPSARMNI
jgi:type IV secretion system protein TrbL